MNPEYAAYLDSPEWALRRKIALDHAENRCQLCDGGGELHVHHRTYSRLQHETPADLVVLCKDCHAKFHDKATPNDQTLNLGLIALLQERGLLDPAQDAHKITMEGVLLAGIVAGIDNIRSSLGLSPMSFVDGSLVAGTVYDFLQGG